MFLNSGKSAGAPLLTDDQLTGRGATDREAAIDAGMVKLLFADARVGETITVLIAVTLVLSQREQFAREIIGGWLVLMLAVVGARGMVRRAYHRRPSDLARTRQWRRAFVAGAALTGLVWGIAGFAMMASPELADAFIIMLVVTGMTSAAVPYLSPAPIAFHLYATAALLPSASLFLSRGQISEFVIGTIMLIYLLGIQRSAHLFSQSLKRAYGAAYDEAIKAQKLEALSAEVARAHQQLQTETAQRLQVERTRRELETQTNSMLATLVEARTSELRDIIDAMATTREQLDSALIAGRLALFEVDTVTRIVTLSAHWSQMLGGPPQTTTTTIGQLMLLVHPEDRAVIRGAYRDALRGTRDYLVDHRVRNRHGQWLWIESRARTVARRPNGTALTMIGTNCDVTLRKENEERLLYQAYHDPLTGLANRAFLRDRLTEMIFRAARANRTLAVLYLDLDHFKVVNDSHGHAAGDRLLNAAAGSLSRSVRQGDVVGRLGGDEFIVLLEGPLSVDDIVATARKLLVQINTPFRIENHEYVLSTSIGISCYPSDGDTADELMTRADLAMYSAKQAGRNVFRFFTGELNDQAREKALLLEGLQSAIANGELWLAYQPRVECGSGKMIGVEALMRWRHPVVGEIPPDRFIPLAEQTGAIVTLGEWVLRTACAQMRAWRDAGAVLRHVAVNLSMRQLMQDDLVSRVAGILSEVGLSPTALSLEITESMAVQEPERVLDALNGLHALGVRIALDDFGTGHSALSYLKRFPFDELKIDRSFALGVPLNGEDAAIARAILALARSLDLTVIAEGVESKSQSDFFIREGCDEMQGYFHGRPVAAADLSLDTVELSAVMVGKQ